MGSWKNDSTIREGSDSSSPDTLLERFSRSFKNTPKVYHLFCDYCDYKEKDADEIGRKGNSIRSSTEGRWLSRRQGLEKEKEAGLRRIPLQPASILYHNELFKKKSKEFYSSSVQVPDEKVKNPCKTHPENVGNEQDGCCLRNLP